MNRKALFLLIALAIYLEARLLLFACEQDEELFPRDESFWQHMCSSMIACLIWNLFAYIGYRLITYPICVIRQRRRRQALLDKEASERLAVRRKKLFWKRKSRKWRRRHRNGW